MADELTIDLEKIAKDFPLEAQYVGHDLRKVAALWNNEPTRPQAEQILDSWIQHGGELRKVLAGAWLQRAKGVIEAGAKAAAAGAEGAAAGVKPDVAPNAEAFHANAAGEITKPGRMPEPTPVGAAPAAPDQGGEKAKLAAKAARWGFKAGRAARAAKAAAGAPGVALGAAVGAAQAAGGYKAAGSVREHALTERQRAAKSRWAGHSRSV